MGSPEPRRKRRRSARARIGFRASYAGGVGYCRRMSRLPNAAVLFSLVMVAAVCVRKVVMNSVRARSAELRAKSRAKKAPLAVLLEEQHEIHYQAAALSDPSSKCLSHTLGGHKQPVTFGVFTCVADARFLLRALIALRGFSPMLVVDVGTPPASDAGGITSGREWDLRQTEQVNRRIKFRSEPLPRSSGLVLIKANKPLSADAWTDVVLTVLKLLTPNGLIVVMEQRPKVIPHRDIEDQDSTWPGSAHLRGAIMQLACGEAGLAVGLAAFDEGIAVVRRARPGLTRLQKGCILPEGVVYYGEPDDMEEGDTSASGASSTATGSSSAASGTASAATETASADTGTASASTGAASATTGTEATATGTEATATSTEATATGTEATTTSTEATATGTQATTTSTEATATGTEATTTGTEATATRTEATPTGTEATATGTVVPTLTQPLLHFEELLAFAMGTKWTPEAVQTKFGGAEAVKKYAHRAGSRLFCVKNLARESEGTGVKKQAKNKPSGEGGEEDSRNLRSSKRNSGSETPEQTARICLEKHMKKHPNDVRGAFVLEMVLQAGGGADGVDVDRQLIRLREEARTERGEAGLSLWKALHARGASGGATGLLLH